MKRALVVVDVQNEYFSGLLPITHPQGNRIKFVTEF
jgi:nicotinamidase-related amidase